jgi:hypothetical protein
MMRSEWVRRLFRIIAIIASALSSLEFNKDLLPVQHRHDAEPEQDVRDRKQQRRVDRLEP